MAYSVKEIYYTIQGEGFHTGRPAVFLRFSGCNLWSGREADRATATCRFCDTEFFGTDGPGGGRFETADLLADTVQRTWEARFTVARTTTSVDPSESTRPFVVCTGGEPLLQLDRSLIESLRTRGCEVAVETNGTLPAPRGLDWICVSPKAGAELIQRTGHELKLVYPQPGAPPQVFAGLAFDHFSLQPMDGPELEANTRATVSYCLAHPHWRLSLQTHKFLGIK